MSNKNEYVLNITKTPYRDLAAKVQAAFGTKKVCHECT